MNDHPVLIIDSFDSPSLAERCPDGGHIVSGPDAAHALGRACGEEGRHWVLACRAPTQTAFLSGLLSALDDSGRTPCLSYLPVEYTGDLTTLPTSTRRRARTLKVNSDALAFPVFGRSLGAGRASTLPLALTRLGGGGASGVSGAARALSGLAGNNGGGGLRLQGEEDEAGTGAVFSEAWLGRLPGVPTKGRGSLELVRYTTADRNRWNPLSGWSVHLADEWEVMVQGEWSVDGRYHSTATPQRLRVSAGPAIDVGHIRISSN